VSARRASCGVAGLRAAPERLDALGRADERRHHEHAEREQHRLQDVRAGVVETEQDRQRPAAGECRSWQKVLLGAAISMKRPALSSVKGPKKPHRVI
jgi:hypothetical protein